MKRIKIFVGLFVFSLLLFPGVKVKAATVVSDETSLRAAIEQGGNIILQNNIFLTEPLVINKDVSIICSGKECVIENDTIDDLIIVNGGNVEMSNLSLYAGKFDNYNVRQGGTVLIVNGGSVKLENNSMDGIKSGDTSVIVNNGATLSLTFPIISSAHANGIEVNDGAKVSLTFPVIRSEQANGIEVNDGSIVNIEGGIEKCDYSSVFGAKNAIYLNGGTVNLSSFIDFVTSDTGYSIYMNKGINTATNGNALVFKDDFVFSYAEHRAFSFNIYVNPDINELRVVDEKDFLVLKDNKLNVGYCINSHIVCVSQSEEDREAVCKNIGGNYNGTIESNELKSCTALYINGEKTVIDEENCKTEEPAQIVTVPSTFLSNMYYVVVGVVLVIIAVFIIYMIVSKKKVKNK